MKGFFDKLRFIFSAEPEQQAQKAADVSKTVIPQAGCLDSDSQVKTGVSAASVEKMREYSKEHQMN